MTTITSIGLRVHDVALKTLLLNILIEPEDKHDSKQFTEVIDNVRIKRSHRLRNA